MAFVELDQDGNVTGVFAVAQTGDPAAGRHYGVVADDDPIFGLARAKVAKRIDAAEYFADLFSPPAGFTVNNKLFQVDDASQARIVAVASLALASLNAPSVPWPPGFGFVAADNTAVPMTPGQMVGFAALVAGYVIGCRLRFRTIKTAISAAIDLPSLALIDITAGYPDPHN